MKPDEVFFRTINHLNAYRLKEYGKPNYFSMYRCSHHKGMSGTKDNLYLTEVVSYGAGIGHQLANWIAGYWFARLFGIKYAYSPFTYSKGSLNLLPFKSTILVYAL